MFESCLLLNGPRMNAVELINMILIKPEPGGEWQLLMELEWSKNCFGGNKVNESDVVTNSNEL